MKKKYWKVSCSTATFYLITDTKNDFDTTGVQQKINAINSEGALGSELIRLFTSNIGFEVSTLEPEESTHMGDFIISK